MGQLLSQPITSKISEKHENKQFTVAVSCMQGWRVSMEDAHTVNLKIPGHGDDSFFGVFDGHGGYRVAEYVSENLIDYILKQEDYDTDPTNAITKGFLSMDQIIHSHEDFEGDNSGSTGVTCLIKDNKIYSANSGDSRVIASVKGRVEQLSFDHKPTDEKEYNRILYAGGWVEFNRVNGNLALSRAFGDFEFKKNTSLKAEEQIITACPDITITEITPDHEFLLMACDGIWDVLMMDEVVDFCRNRIAQQMDPVKIVEDLLNRCLSPDCQMSGLGCDNMTAVLILFTNGEPYSTLATKCARPSESLIELTNQAMNS